MMETNKRDKLKTTLARVAAAGATLYTTLLVLSPYLAMIPPKQPPTQGE